LSGLGGAASLLGGNTDLSALASALSSRSGNLSSGAIGNALSSLGSSNPFSSQAAALNALNKLNSGSGGGSLMNDEYNGGPVGVGGGSRSSDTIIITNLPLGYNRNLLKEKFSDVGDIEFAEIRAKGTGIIRFATERAAQRAVNCWMVQGLMVAL